MLGDLLFMLLLLHIGWGSRKSAELGPGQQSVRALRACPYEINPEQKSAPCSVPL